MKYLAVVLILALTLAARADSKSEGADVSAKTRFDGAKIRDSRPRIWLDDGRVAWLKKKMAGKSIDALRAECGTSTEGLALAYVISGDDKTGREAVERTASSKEKRAMRTIALVYDWCHPLLSPDQKAGMREQLIKWCKEEISTGRSWRSFHNGMYNAGVPVGMAAIAIYGDDPYAEEALRFLNQEWEDVLRTFENVFPDGAWGEGFDYNRHVSYEAMRYFLALKTATGKDFIADSLHLRNTIYYIMYCTKPNALVLPEKDCDWPFAGEWDRDCMLMLAWEYRDGRAQHYLNHCIGEEFKPGGRNRWKDALWYDPELPEKDPAQLPLSRIFRDDGLVIARSGWAWDSPQGRAQDTWIAFRCGKYYGDHAHYDNNSFEIYRKGELAVDSGRYDDDWGMEQDPDEILKSQFFNYYQRTIAHNSVLVYDPNEKLEMGVVNDGGQLELLRVKGARNVPEDYDQGTFPSEPDRKGICDWKTNPGRWDTGTILAYMGTKDFTYVCADATKSYSPAKMKSFIRQFLFVQPDVVVVLDRVVSTQPEFKKTWLLHTVNEPTAMADGRYYEMTYGEGRLVLAPVLPEKRSIAKIGGPGNEFLVAGIQYACGLNASSGRKADLHYGELPGAWRIEESPSEPSAADIFINVMLLTDSGSRDYPFAVAKELDSGKVELTVMTQGGTVATVAFAKEGSHAGTLKLVRGADVKIAGALWIYTGGETVFDGLLPTETILEEGRP